MTLLEAMCGFTEHVYHMMCRLCMYAETCLPLSQFSLCLFSMQEFKELMATMVHSLRALAGKSCSTTETVELQLAGCVLVVVLVRVGWLDSRGKLEMLGIQILIELMNILKLPATDPPFIQQWCASFREQISLIR